MMVTDVETTDQQIHTDLEKMELTGIHSMGGHVHFTLKQTAAISCCLILN